MRDSQALPARGKFGRPLSLELQPQWVAWQQTPSRKPGGKAGKVPINPHTGRRASTTDPATWGSYEEAGARATRDGLAGVGFVFRADGGLVGVDLDGCRDAASGALVPWAADFIRRLESYTEVSPSGTGVHVLVRGALPAGRRRKGSVEMYDRARFFTVTGKRLPDTPAEIAERTDVLAAIHSETFASPNREQATPTSPAPGAVARVTDDELLARAVAAQNGAKFDSLWRGDTTGYDSASEADAALCCHLAFWTGKDAAQIDTLFRQSALMRNKWDERRGSSTYGAQTIASAIAQTSDVYSGPAPERPSSASPDENLATRVVSLVRASGAELFHDPDGEPHTLIPREGHVEVLRLKDRAFQRWLSALAYRELGKAVGSTVMADALRSLEALACYEGVELPVHVRSAATDDGIVIDRGDPGWTAFVVTPTGWQTVDRAPVVFRRNTGMLALPEPKRGGAIDALRPFLNCHDADYPLLLAWLVAALRPQGPYPVLALIGEQGSAKSTTARVLRALVDPNKAPLRNPSRSDRDLMVSATSSWVVAFDNVSQIPQWLSDAMCCVATGSGFSARTLYTDDAETILTASRPIVLTGIEDYVSRSDLLDRALLVKAPVIDKARRRDEESFWRDFRAVESEVFAALLDAVACGVRRLPQIRPEEMPRMADFSRWATACEPGLGLDDGDVVRALRRSADEAIQVAVEASPIGRAVQALVEERGDIELSATELLALLNDRRGGQFEPQGWPKAGNVLSAQLRRLAPNLRELGIDVEQDKAERGNKRLLRLRRVRGGIVRTVLSVHASPEGEIPPAEPAPGMRTIPRTIEDCEPAGSSTPTTGHEGVSAWPEDDVDGEDDPPAPRQGEEVAA
jgi:hypothetical protein